MIRNTNDAEETLKSYETRLLDVHRVPTEEKVAEKQQSQIKV